MTWGVRALVALLVAATVSACGFLGGDPAAQACATADEGHQVRDEADGFELCLPPSWRDLAVGDPGWVTVYGRGESTTESQVRDGTIQSFAVPLAPRGDDPAANLAVYVRQAPANETLTAVAERYVATLEKNGATVTDRHDLTLPAGPAVLITSTRRPGKISPTVDRLLAYILVHGGHTFHLLYVSQDETADAFAPMFDASVRSLRFLDD
jgi:hypothetical protein